MRRHDFASAESVLKEKRTRRENFRERWNASCAAITSIAVKIGATSQTLLNWVRQLDRDIGQRERLTTVESQPVKKLEREVKELWRANGILKLASAFFD